MNIECDVVDVNALDPRKYQMIVTPALYSVKEDVLRKLEEFVRKGGVLVSSFKSFVADEHFSVYPDTQPHILHKCFGMSYNQFTEPGKTTLKGKPVRYFAELLKTEGAESLADYEHKYWGRYAAVTHQEYGKGNAYYIGCYTEKEILKEIYQKAALDAGICDEAMEYTWPVIIRSGIDQEGKKLHYVFHYDDKEEGRCIKCPYECVQDLTDGTVYRKDDPVYLGDWDVKILEEI